MLPATVSMGGGRRSGVSRSSRSSSTTTRKPSPTASFASAAPTCPAPAIRQRRRGLDVQAILERLPSCRTRKRHAGRLLAADPRDGLAKRRRLRSVGQADDGDFHASAADQPVVPAVVLVQLNVEACSHSRRRTCVQRRASPGPLPPHLGLDAAAADRSFRVAVGMNQEHGPGGLRRRSARLDDRAQGAGTPRFQAIQQGLEQLQRLAHGSLSLQADRHRADAHAGGVEHGVGDGRGDGDDRRLAAAGRVQVRAVQQVDVQLGHVVEPRHLVAAEAGVEDLAVLEADLLAQRPAQAHDDAALHLGEEVGRVQDRAALEDLADAADLDLALVAVDGHLDAGGHVGALLRAAGQPDADVRRTLLAAARPSRTSRRPFPARPAAAGSSDGPAGTPADRRRRPGPVRP